MLFKKMLRDLSNYKVQFISIFLLAFMGVFLFSGINSEASGLQITIDDYYEETNLADGWIYSNYLADEFLQQVDLLGPTTQMERHLVVDSIAKMKNSPDITLHFVENNTISKFYLLEGEKLNIDDSDGVWLDKDFADARNLTVGDNITFTYGDIEIEKEIKGLGYSPEYVFNTPYYLISPDFDSYGFAYLSYKAFPSDNITYNVLEVKFDGKPDTYDQLLSYRLDDYYSSFIEQSQQRSVSEFNNQVSQHRMMADIFPFVFIAVSILILLTTIKRIIFHQRTQIGILKANGFKDTALIKHYMSYGLFIVSVASLMGLILGPVLLPPLSYSIVTDVFKFPSLDPLGFMNYIWLVIIIVLFTSVVSYFTIKNLVNEHPSISMRPRAPESASSYFLEKFKVWKKLPFNIRWNYRNIKRHKFRSVMTILGVLGCTALLISAFGIYEGMEDLKDWDFNQINHFDSKLYIDNGADSSHINDIVKDVKGQKIMEASVTLESGYTREAAALLVLNHTDLITPTDANHEKIKIKDDDILISKKMADILNLHVGDTVKWQIEGSDKWVKSKIDKIYADPISQGIILSADKLEKSGLNYTSTSIITSQHIDKEYNGIKSVNTLEDRLDTWNDVYMSVQLLIVIMMFFAVVLAVVVIYNLHALSFLEMETEIITLKILGFKSRSLVKLLLTQSLFFITVGIILGIPLGYYVLSGMWESAGKRFYQVAFISPVNLILTCVIIFSVCIAINMLFLYRIRKFDIAGKSKIFE